MAQALLVEKTSKRGGRIVHEKDLMPPPMFGESFKTSFGSSEDNDATPPQVQPETDEYGDPIMVPDPNPQQPEAESEPKPSITDLMKNPSKVVLCQVKRIIKFLVIIQYTKYLMSPEYGRPR